MRRSVACSTRWARRDREDEPSTTVRAADKSAAEPLVRVDQLYLSPSAVTGVPASDDDAALIGDLYGVQVVRDASGRPAVSVADAIRIGCARAAVEAELRRDLHDNQRRTR